MVGARPEHADGDNDNAHGAGDEQGDAGDAEALQDGGDEEASLAGSSTIGGSGTGSGLPGSTATLASRRS
jgi:hypothetical protein